MFTNVEQERQEKNISFFLNVISSLCGMKGEVQALWALALGDAFLHFLKIISHNRLRMWRRKRSPFTHPLQTVKSGDGSFTTWPSVLNNWKVPSS